MVDTNEQIVQLAIKNFPAQQVIFDDPARFKIAVKGRRFGLTKGAANDFIKCALEGSFQRGLWGDTINANIDKYVQRYFLPHLRKIPQDRWQWRKQDRILYIENAYIDFRSADKPENWEGFGYDKFFLNEAGIILKDEYLWYNAIRPMLEEYIAHGVIGGTPKGKGLFENLANKGKDPNNKDYKFFHFTSYDNPYLPKEVVDNLAADMPEVIRKQEIYAEFLDDGGEVFRHVNDAAVAVPQPPKSGHYYVMGVDLAKVQDWTVIVVYDRANNSQVYQDRFQNFEWPFQKAKIMAIAQHYNNALINIDATGPGSPIYDDLVRAGCSIEPFIFTNTSKKDLVEKLSIWIELKKCRFINTKDTMYEFGNFSYEISPSGKIVYGARNGYHDDIVIAHALAIWLLSDQYIELPKGEEPLIRAEFRRRMQERGNEQFLDPDDYEEQ